MNKFFKKLISAVFLPILIISVIPYLIFAVTKDVWELIDTQDDDEEDITIKESKILSKILKSNTKNRKTKSI